MSSKQVKTKIPTKKVRHVTVDDVRKYKVDWSRWRNIVHYDVSSFDCDAVVFVAKRLGFVCDERPIRGQELAMELEHVCEILIAMYELGWEAPKCLRDSGLLVYDDYCTAYKSVKPSDGLYHAYLKFTVVKNVDDGDYPTWLNPPMIEIKLELDKDGKPTFDINFNIVSQS